MKIKVITESIIIPKGSDIDGMELKDGATAGDVVKIMEQEGLTGTLTAQEVLDTHMLICNSRHIKAEQTLCEGDTLIIMKTLIGG